MIHGADLKRRVRAPVTRSKGLVTRSRCLVTRFRGPVTRSNDWIFCRLGKRSKSQPRRGPATPGVLANRQIPGYLRMLSCLHPRP
ncbi:hypothetical protein T484DRAFT_1962648 [Baffinella frigidus]|nr:hypothetical protein T484DRAFT_1962648 [Cryptophyta sp. CCMP2293]